MHALRLLCAALAVAGSLAAEVPAPSGPNPDPSGPSPDPDTIFREHVAKTNLGGQGRSLLSHSFGPVVRKVTVSRPAVAAPVVKHSSTTFINGPIVRTRIIPRILAQPAEFLPQLAPIPVGQVYPVPSVVQAPVPVEAEAPVAVHHGPVLSQFHAQDELGRYAFGYNAGISTREETKDEYGTVRGSYSYLDPYGEVQKQEYVADDYGFRVRGTNLPVHVASR